MAHTKLQSEFLGTKKKNYVTAKEYAEKYHRSIKWAYALFSRPEMAEVKKHIGPRGFVVEETRADEILAQLF